MVEDLDLPRHDASNPATPSQVDSASTAPYRTCVVQSRQPASPPERVAGFDVHEIQRPLAGACHLPDWPPPARLPGGIMKPVELPWVLVRRHAPPSWLRQDVC